jgi:hypothetical protein
MSEKPSPQSAERHARYVLGFHFVTGSLLLINLLWAAYRAITALSADHVVALLLAVGLTMLYLYARIFATGNQDRIIRLEERLRMKDLLPSDLQPRIGEYTTNQLVALRFASDEELPDLARQVLDEGIQDRSTIKKRVKSWRPDYQRV